MHFGPREHDGQSPGPARAHDSFDAVERLTQRRLEKSGLCAWV